jgi:hypothetical protein
LEKLAWEAGGEVGSLVCQKCADADGIAALDKREWKEIGTQ